MAAQDTVAAFVGLGTMGSALSTHLLAAGWRVAGYDIDPARLAAHTGRGGEAAGFCRAVNDELAAFAAGSGGRITPVATLPMQDPVAAVAELCRTVTGLGMRGAQIGPDVAGTPLDDPGPRTVLAAAADLGVPPS